MLEMLIKKINKSKNQKGFTLVELIVVIAILGILAAVAIPRFAGFSGSANAKATLATLSTMDSAAQAYATENNVELSTVTAAHVQTTLGWTALPTNSPKGVTYTVVGGVATATVATGTTWVKDKAITAGLTATDIKAY